MGNGITITSNPGRLVLDETDKVCLAAFSAILPLTSAMERNITAPWDYIDKAIQLPGLNAPSPSRLSGYP